MSTPLDREGIFKAKPLSWELKTSTTSQSVAISVRYKILAQLDGGVWVDWTGYDPVHIWGSHTVVKRDGSPNGATIDQVAECFGWTGSLRDVATKPPPDVVVQLNVETETYNGKQSLRVRWLNPENYSPNKKNSDGGASEVDVAGLEARFGGLLRAAASSRKAPNAPPAKPKAVPATASAVAPKEPEAKPMPDDIPF